MSAPAQVAMTADGYGEPQQSVVSARSEGVMDNLSRAAEVDVAKARDCLKEGYEAALSKLEMQYQAEKALLGAKYADLDGRLVNVQETIANYKTNAVKAMDIFLTECRSASVVAVELVPVLAEPERPIEPPTPKFLERHRGEVTPLRRAGAPMVLLAIAVLTTVGVGIGVAVSQEPGKQIQARSAQWR